MGAFSDATGKRSRDKRFLENWIQNLKDRVMQYSVAHRRFMDAPQLGIVDPESFIRTVTIGFGSKLAAQCKNVLLDILFEQRNIRFVPFVAFERFPSREKIFRRND